MDFNINGHNIFIIVSVCFLASLIFVQMMKKVAIFLKILDIVINLNSLDICF